MFRIKDREPSAKDLSVVSAKEIDKEEKVWGKHLFGKYIFGKVPITNQRFIWLLARNIKEYCDWVNSYRDDLSKIQAKYRHIDVIPMHDSIRIEMLERAVRIYTNRIAYYYKTFVKIAKIIDDEEEREMNHV